jgi:hypothetical protein
MGLDDKLLQSFSVTLSFGECNLAVVAFRGLARAFTQFPNQYPPVSIILQKEVSCIPEEIQERFEKRKKKFDAE